MPFIHRQELLCTPEILRWIIHRYLEMPSICSVLVRLVKKGVLALMCDSTNAERPGFTMSEKTVGKTFDNIFAEHKNTRIIIATFASNVDRVQQIINSAYKYGRKVVVEGRSMVNIITIASELGYLNIPDNTLIDIEQLKNYPDEKTVIDHNRKPGRVHGGIIPYGKRHASKDNDQAEGYHYFQFQSDSGK